MLTLLCCLQPGYGTGSSLRPVPWPVLPVPTLSACAGSVLRKGTRRLDRGVWDLSFFLLVTRFCFSSWGLSAQTGFCSVLAWCLSPGWAGCAALAGAGSQTMCCSSAAAQVLMGLFSANSGAEHRGLSALSTAAKKAVQTPVVVRE